MTRFKHDKKWTADRIETLWNMWNDGSSADAIARALQAGITRDGVICQVRILREAGVEMRAGRETTKLRSNAAQTRPTPIKPGSVCKTIRINWDLFARHDGDDAVPLLDVRTDQCRWPLGEVRDGSFAFCGCRKERGDYCARHARRAYQPRASAKDAEGEAARVIGGRPQGLGRVTANIIIPVAC